MREELILKSPLSKIARPKVPKYRPKPFSEDEVKQPVMAAETQPDETWIREIAILLFFLDTGVRTRELLGLQLDSIQIDNGQALEMGRAPNSALFILPCEQRGRSGVTFRWAVRSLSRMSKTCSYPLMAAR